MENTGKAPAVNDHLGCELVWRRGAGGKWILHYKRRFMGLVVPDDRHPKMYRRELSGGRYSAMANLTRAKDAAIEAALRELQWEARAAIPKLPPLAEMEAVGRA
jgi:hypothetical protein